MEEANPLYQAGRRCLTGGKDQAGAQGQTLWAKGWCFLLSNHSPRDALVNPNAGARKTQRIWKGVVRTLRLFPRFGERTHTHDHQQASRKETLFIYAPSRLHILNEGSRV